jgi:uncharacterized protein YkwD
VDRARAASRCVRPFDEETPAPGEELADPDPERAILRMANEVRARERLRPLPRAAELDALAREHAVAMARAKRAAHDIGDGDAAERFLRAGLDARVVGENVARAASPALAHRALWGSPSHRTNLLSAEYTRMGVGVVTEDGYVYVCQIFT